ncbi:MAG: hypothetical protein GDA67_16655 [Nitrospira sp. CR1.3]|nr:hypothetical protein [Nitrospira sp. CR1.3]
MRISEKSLLVRRIALGYTYEPRNKERGRDELARGENKGVGSRFLTGSCGARRRCSYHVVRASLPETSPIRGAIATWGAGRCVSSLRTTGNDSRPLFFAPFAPFLCPKVESYTYDGNDNLLTRVTPKAETISFEYNAVNELIKKTLPGNLLTQYGYDTVGNLTSVTDSDSALTMTYNQANRLLTTATTGSSNQPAVTLTYTYDKNGNRLTAVDPFGTNTATYDALNRLASLASPAGLATLTYDALSRRTSLTLPNGTQTSYTYDVASQAQSILHKIAATSTQINKADYLYNGVGNRTSLTDRRGAQTFGYDTLDRLTSASHPLLGTPQSFAYDAVGNRTTGGSVVNAGNQLTATTTHSYEYDDNGNVTKKTLLATGNFTVYSYDVENRLTKVEDFAAGNPTPTATSTYRYDGLGRRIEKVANGQTRRYVYDGEDILLEYDGSNALQARYTHGPGIDEPIAVTRGSSTYYYHADMLGSVSELTDSIGTVAKAYAYDAYGNIVEQTGTVENSYTYTGREFDAETGLYHYRKRTYDSRLGRFISRDPAGFWGGDTNFYAYSYNEPMDWVDPYGLFSMEEFVADLPTLPQEFVDLAVGFGDAFLIPELVRNYQGLDGVVNKCSTSYVIGKISGFVTGGAPFVLRGTAALGATRIGHILNHNRYARIGPGRMPANGHGLPSGTDVPRIVFGPDRPGMPKPPHFDLRSRSPYAPPLGGLECDCE